MNINVHGKNSLQHIVKTPPLIRRGDRVRIQQTMELAVAPDEYTFTIGFAMISPMIMLLLPK
jgi:hypothetical protein